MQHRVLIVDDFPDAAEMVCLMLGMLGHQCRTAVCGRQALEVAAEFEPDIAILDIGLPDISGYDLAKELRKLQGNRPLYLAAVTGWGQPEDRSRAYAAGFDQHVLKPADSTKLREIIRSAERHADSS